jgi:hypothetical protein
VSTRKQNELRFPEWQDLAGGGRLYRRVVTGRSGWRAIYCMEVDPSENTQKFWQEIFDDQGRLREIHEKFPVDRGHKRV